MASFAKFTRPEVPQRGVITDRDLDIIEAVLRFRFSPTSELVRLVAGNEDVTMRRLRRLWEWDLLTRFAFPSIRTHSEFIYYIDQRQTLELLVERQRFPMIHNQMDDEIRMNREADYAGAATRGQHMKLGFLQHSLMISRMHFMLEMSARNHNGEIVLANWRQGAELRGNKVEVPEITSRRVAGTNEYKWEEHDFRKYRLPVEPDALFTLSFPDRREAHFCYEADRGTMPMADMLKKFRAYHHFIKRQQKHRKAFGIHPIRAVLVETTDEPRARKLMELAQHPAVIGEGKRSSLFWFAISPLFTAPDARGTGRATGSYLLQTQIVFDQIWALPDLTLHALEDTEN